MQSIGVPQGSTPTFIEDSVGAVCPHWWTEGCGEMDSLFGTCANCLEATANVLEPISDAIWCLGSPCAFPLIFCFDSDPHTNETSGWAVSMLGAPCRRPISCCFAITCPNLAQWEVRRRALGGDMSRYTLWQGQHDGPHCLARYCDGAPITIRSGTYGESDCPHAFLCFEVCLLGGICSPCCSFNVSRNMMKDERGLGMDPTEARQEKCVGFFGECFRNCQQLACCVGCAGCIIGCCAPGGEGSQECSGEAGRASRACFSIAHTLWRGIWSVKIIAIGCMSAQMMHEDMEVKDSLIQSEPKSMEMDRGSNAEIGLDTKK
mmetsp:Transcript_14318/g.14506  ORF Transcript_14318/g.14506 Transcript_14318/m.14506 type:complete len:319 (-) Transcript_14318:108-1064(-)|eukprot:CAMPEP_0171305720 /NCGR_PEP_ID=MMETSP0816-20121228/15569_1 /TAXON_ID=420281 /ORGANISM="Proboscia inermis, Strain CCAP1064/1" /LENGTH=318 /DNA_ID=CAMNT_0011786733 /DNA_START=152 /DNA_END=1108 /DNA_ORIENTATION=-